MGRMSIIKELLFKVKGSAPGKAIVLKTRSAGAQERETEHYQLHGIASGTTPDARGIEVSIGTAGRVIVATHNYNLEVEVEAGQTKIYSTTADGKTLKSLINLDINGNIDLNGDSDFAVAFNDLKSGFDALKSDHNTFLTHVHGPAGTPAVPPAIPSTASIDASKVDTVRLP